MDKLQKSVFYWGVGFTLIISCLLISMVILPLVEIMRFNLIISILIAMGIQICMGLFYINRNMMGELQR